MPKILHIFDVSPFIHAAKKTSHSKLEQVIPDGTSWKTQVTPTGGTSLLFNHIYNICNTGDVVFCCDRNPTIKKDMSPGYKSTRNHEQRVAVEKAAAEYILQECGFTVLARAGYEADDIIYTLVQKLHKAYDNIYIYTSDSDLYFLVDDVVSIKPSSTRAKEITRANYEQQLAKKGAKYNTLTVQKIIKGDTSDNIPALPKNVQLKVANALYKDEFYPYLGDKKFVRDWVAYLVPEALNQVDLVFPLYIEDIPTEFSKPDIQTVVNFGDAINNSIFRGHGDRDFDIKPHVIELQDKRGIYIEEDN